MKSMGYRTAFFGKWNLGAEWYDSAGNIVAPGYDDTTVDVDAGIARGGPADQGFDYSFNLPSGIQNSPYAYFENNDWYPIAEDSVIVPLDAEDQEEIGSSVRNGKKGDSNWNSRDAGPMLAAKAVEFIDRHISEYPAAPFLMYYSSQAVHVPHTPPDMLGSDAVKGATGISDHADLIYELDLQVGAIVKKLEDEGILDQTMIIFTSDNGGLEIAETIENGHFSNLGLRGKKGQIYEGGHRVPFIVRWPEGVAPGTISDQAMLSSDWIATMYDLLGVPMGNQHALDSVSILPVLTGLQNENNPIRDHFLIKSAHSRGQHAIRAGDDVLIYQDLVKSEFYNLAADPLQINNLINDQASQSRIAEMDATFMADWSSSRTSPLLDYSDPSVRTQWDICGVNDVDSDGDGVFDCDDEFPSDPNEWLDTDGDGVGDNSDIFPNDPTEWADRDGDSIGDNGDAFPDDLNEWADSDGDGVGDNTDAFPNDPSETADTDGDGVGNNADDLPNDPNETVDTDGDGVGDNSDAFPNDPAESADSDGDGVGDNGDAFPNDPNESADSDGDGVGDNADAFPNDSNETTDTDGDGVGDNSDAFPNDPAESADSDGDGVGDNGDAFPNDPSETADTDGDGFGNNRDAFPTDPNESADSDGDGVGDNGDAFPNDPAESADSDGDGFGNNRDAFPTDPNESADSDGDGVGDNGDAFPNDPAESADSDGDGFGNNRDAFPTDPNESADSDGDGVGDNGDAYPNNPNESADTDGDGVGDNADAFPDDATETVDTDGDGHGDNGDVFPDDDTEWSDRDEDGVGDNSDPYPDDPTNTPPLTVGKLHHGVLSNVGSADWVSVTLPETYTDMVVVASVAYDGGDLPAVARVRNAVGNGFEVRVQNPGNATLSGYTVTWVAAEAGVYTEAADGITYEAVKFDSSVTDENNSWVGEARSYANAYSSPVVIGQVMSASDPDWSVFWAHGGARNAPPSASTLFVGKNVAEDPDATRADETIGYMVFESGTATSGRLVVEAGLGADSVKGVGDAAPYDYPVMSTEGTALVSAAAIDGGNGGWPVLYGPNHLGGGSLSLAFDEDQLQDSERNHTTEQVAYIVFGSVPNTSPALAGIGNHEIDEHNLLTFVATATDADVPPDSLTYSLGAGAPAGADIHPTTGAFTWTPTEAQGPGSHAVTIIVTDDGAGNLSDSETITITVNEINGAPVLAAIGDQSVDEQATLTFTAGASDLDLPANTLTFSLGAGAPAGANIHPTSGVFTWTPTEAQGATVYNDVKITVTDNGTPILSDSETITITVNDVNTAPILNSIGGKNVNEDEPITFTVTATDQDLPADTLTFSLDAAPAGATIDETSGVFTWTPSEGQDAGDYNATISVTDGNLSDSETITITVSEVNVAPVLGAIGPQSVDEQTTLAFTATATDQNSAVTLTFGLAGASAGATIHPTSGVFTWTPTEAQGGAVYNDVEIIVTDNGAPNLSDSETFAITVNEVNVAPVLGAIGDRSVDEQATLTFTATATDLDRPADTLTFSLSAGAPAGATINPTSGVFTWTPAEGQGGTVENATITVSDGTDSDQETIAITVNDPPADLQVTNMEVSTNKVYELDVLNPGVRVYIDRTYTWTSIPALYQGQQFIRTANGDKKNKDANHLSFDINVAATVYVLLDDRATRIPAWLDGSWSSNSDMVNNTDVPRRVYFKSFAAGRVVLGGNLRSPATGARSNYNVVVIPD